MHVTISNDIIERAARTIGRSPRDLIEEAIIRPTRRRPRCASALVLAGADRAAVAAACDGTLLASGEILFGAYVEIGVARSAKWRGHWTDGDAADSLEGVAAAVLAACRVEHHRAPTAVAVKVYGVGKDGQPAQIERCAILVPARPA